MSNTPYFDAYEERRARRNVLNSTLTSNIAIGTGATLGVSNLSAINISTGGNYVYSRAEYPKYRLQKIYTFIGEIRVVQDCHLEIQETPSAGWRTVEESFSAYV